MITECPQCKAALSPQKSRFCDQCGFDLRGDQITNTATLHILLHEGNVIEHELTRIETKIGKGPTNDIVLADPTVSTEHAVIRQDKLGHIIVDLSSRNGTFINGARLAEPCVLHHGDVIKMGRCTIAFRLNLANDTAQFSHTTPLITMQPYIPPVTEDALAAAVIAAGLVDAAEVERLRSLEAKGRRLFRALIEEMMMTDIGLRDLMSSRFRLPIVDVSAIGLDQEVTSAISPHTLREQLVFPAVVAPDQLMLVMADPTNGQLIEHIKQTTNRSVEVRLAAASEIAAHLDRYFAPRLIGVLPSGEKLEALITKPEIEIGKAPHNQIVLTHPTVSNIHAMILVRDGGYSIVDLGSSNGTFVNGEQLKDQAYSLQHGDKIQIAEVTLFFRSPVEETENNIA